jgi:tetratricopeptide (TPR) repeat protein
VSLRLLSTGSRSAIVPRLMSRIPTPWRVRTARICIGIAAALVLLSNTGCEELSARRQIQKANKLYAQGKFSKSVEEYEAALGKADLPIGHHNAGLAYLKLFKAGIETPQNLGYAAKATEHFQTYLRAFPDDARVIGLMTQVWLDSGQYDSALAYWEQELAESPKNTEILSYLASINRQAGNWEKAVEWHYEQHEAEPGEDGKAGALVDIAKLIWHKLQDKDGLTGLERIRVADIGIGALQQAAELKPDDIDVHRYLASMFQLRAMGHGAAWAQAVDRASSQIHQGKVIELSKQHEQPAPAGDGTDEPADEPGESKNG